MTEREKNRTNPQLDGEAFEILYRRFYPRLYNFALKITWEASVSQDMVHEVFIKLWENRSNLDGYNYGGLLFKMTRNMCFNHLKHKKIVLNKSVDLKNSRQWEELYRIEFVKDDPYLLIEKELAEQFQEIVNDLPERCKEVFILSRVNGMKNREIALELNLSLKTIEKHISYALRILRARFMLPVLTFLLSFFSF
jgi:RNA polymerase sigma-70 factor (ECF subfamily)